MPNGFPTGFGILVPLAIAAIGAHVWALIEAGRYRTAVDDTLCQAYSERYPEHG